ncbi:MAG: hypothetical protein NWE92_07075 [Candidatus Bathyarchaeota archaeon]|nr:hypothetical protein [Candidatus Bathyarchaeota archaeon]
MCLCAFSSRILDYLRNNFWLQKEAHNDLFYALRSPIRRSSPSYQKFNAKMTAMAMAVGTKNKLIVAMVDPAKAVVAMIAQMIGAKAMTEQIMARR